MIRYAIGFVVGIVAMAPKIERYKDALVEMHTDNIEMLKHLESAHEAITKLRSERQLLHEALHDAHASYLEVCEFADDLIGFQKRDDQQP